jgi:hypothetical protein
MPTEDFGDKGKWTSHRKNWKIDKTFIGTGVHMDIKKKIIRMNPKNSWVRFETEDIIHIYTFEQKPQPLKSDCLECELYKEAHEPKSWEP